MKNNQIIPFTKHGFSKLQNDLENLISKRPEAVKSLSRAREMGDLSENGLYKAAKFELSNIDREIRNLKYLIKSAKIFSPINNNKVQIGHKVTISTLNLKKIFYLVGEHEANPKENKISNKSPIGYSLMGKKINDEITINTPNGILKYKILSIE